MKPCPLPRPLLVVLCLLLAGCLVAVLSGCAMGIGKDKSGTVTPFLKVGPAADATVQVIEDAEARGEIPDQSSGDLLEILLYVAAGLLGVGGAGYGAKRVASKVVAAYDAAPFTPADAASLKAAEVVAATPPGPQLKPVV